MSTEKLSNGHSSHALAVDRSRLAPKSACFAQSPPRERARSPLGLSDSGATGRASDTRGPGLKAGRRRVKRRKAGWAKLLWLKQGYADNYTDEYTFLDHLERNPRLQPYEFWRLVTESATIVQHVCSVAVFVCCFTGIFQERISPTTVVSYSSVMTMIGWMLCDFWDGQQEKEAKLKKDDKVEGLLASSSTGSVTPNISKASEHTHEKSILSRPSSSHASGISTPIGFGSGTSIMAAYNHADSTSYFSPRTFKRLSTIKSSILIYCALLGLSPILKSLTRSTTSDSIWAMSSWLMCINVAFFDYGGGVGAKFPASLSTNAALMASTVLASRLTSTTHVFSLTVFSIEVFGLFPVFRRHLQHVSARAHVLLTILLVMCASAGLGVTVSGGGWAAAVIGCFLGSLITVLSMGICTWWLIGLQKYKNEIHGPWDQAHPVLRTRWE